MKSVLAFTIVACCCILVAECNEEFHMWMSKKMSEMMCKEKTNPDLFKKCMKEHMPSEVMEVAMEVTEIDDADKCLEALCDEDLHKRVCMEVMNRNKEFELNEDVMNNIKECLKSSD